MVKYYAVERGCTKCLSCYYCCPTGAIDIDPQTGAHIDPEKCVACGSCVEECVAEAIVAVEEE
ncbi:MAG: 4Fe-4S binding protein [Clostridiales bacterium]|nr:4Fe-4S binding protein [Clostridiales bacterium]